VRDPNDKNASYYNLFLNRSQLARQATGGLAVGLSLRQLNETEMALYCSGRSRPRESIHQGQAVPRLYERRPFVDESVWLRVFSAGCYYMDASRAAWSSRGVESLAQTSANLSRTTHCVASHLTQFAAGLIVVPHAIDFSFVWSNASFERNSLVYSTVIGLVCVYALLALYALFMDRRDRLKTGLVYLQDNRQEDGYYYELIVWTGNRSKAGCSADSRIDFVLSGDLDETRLRSFRGEEDKNKNRQVLCRAGVDSFIVAVPRPLGNINYMRVWRRYSSSAKSQSNAGAGWYFKCAMLRDLQTREKFYFICEQWLAVDKSDSRVERLVPACSFGHAQLGRFRYLLTEETKQSMLDGHLWLSVFARPPQSPFSRLERLTCCFVLLALTMLANILYYETQLELEQEPESNQQVLTNDQLLRLGPFRVTLQSVD
jgi:polycystin 1L2